MNVQNADGETPLICALKYGLEKSALEILEFPVDVNVRDVDRCCALHYAIDTGKWAAAKILIERVVIGSLTSARLAKMIRAGRRNLADIAWERIEDFAGGHACRMLNNVFKSELLDPVIDVSVVSWFLEHGADPNFEIETADGFVSGYEYILRKDARVAELLSHYGIKGLAVSFATPALDCPL